MLFYMQSLVASAHIPVPPQYYTTSYSFLLSVFSLKVTVSHIF